MSNVEIVEMSKKTCVIVGAGEGLGLGIARKFGKNGYKIALIARRKEKLDELVAKLAKDDIDARAFVGDVSNDASLGRALTEIKLEYGPIDVLEYSPEPHTPPKDLREWMPTTMTMAEVEKRMRLSCYGAITCVNLVLPDMLERKSGTIITTMSGSGLEPIKTLCAVAMSMSALHNYTVSLNEELQGKGVFAGVVCLSLLIEEGDKYGDPDVLAAQYWDLHVKRDRALLNITTPVDPHQHHLDDMKKYGVEMPKE